MVAECLSYYLWDGIEWVQILLYTLIFFPVEIFLNVGSSHLC